MKFSCSGTKQNYKYSVPKHYVTAIQRFFCLSIICIQRTISNHILLIIPPKNHHCHCHRFLRTRRLDASLTSGRRCSPEVCPFASVGSSWERLWSDLGMVRCCLISSPTHMTPISTITHHAQTDGQSPDRIWCS